MAAIAVQLADTRKRLLASRIRKARREMPLEGGRRVSQQAFADTLGVHPTTIAGWERGSYAPSALHLGAIAKVTARPLEWFFGAVEDDEATVRLRRIERGISILDDLREALEAAATALNGEA